MQTKWLAQNLYSAELAHGLIITCSQSTLKVMTAGIAALTCVPCLVYLSNMNLSRVFVCSLSVCTCSSLWYMYYSLSAVVWYMLVSV